MSLDPIQRRKVTLFFRVLDANENGFVERADFERVADQLVMRHQMDPASEDYTRVKNTFTRVYDSIREMTDLDQDNRVSLNEWWTYFEQVLYDENQFAELIAPMARNIFTLLDHDDDGKIGLVEFRHFGEVYRIEADIDALFAKLDMNGNGYITRDEFGHIATDFFLNRDIDVPGNYLFGAF
jgi:Ca2+-binding EF-hand superfamily protein